MRTAPIPNVATRVIGLRPGAEPPPLVASAPVTFSNQVHSVVERVMGFAHRFSASESMPEAERVSQRNVGYDVSDPKAQRAQLATQIDAAAAHRVEAQAALGDLLDGLVTNDPGVKLLMQLASDDSLLAGSRVRPDQTRVFALTGEIGIGRDGFVHINRSDPRRDPKDAEGAIYDISFTAVTPEQFPRPDETRRVLEGQLSRTLQEVKASVNGDTAYLSYRLLGDGAVSNPPSPMVAVIEGEPTRLPGTPAEQRAELTIQIADAKQAAAKQQATMGSWLSQLVREDRGVQTLMKAAADPTLAKGSFAAQAEVRAMTVTGNLGISPDGFVRVESQREYLPHERVQITTTLHPVDPAMLGPGKLAGDRGAVEKGLADLLKLVLDAQKGATGGLSWRLVGGTHTESTAP